MKGATVEDVAAEVGADLGAAGRVTPASLAVIREVLRPFLDASPSLGVRVVVGTRRNNDRGNLAAALASNRVEIDLDADKSGLCGAPSERGG